MNCSRTVTANAFLSKQSAAQALKTLNGNLITTTSVSRPAFIALRHQYVSSNRQFSTSNTRRFKPSQDWLMKEFFPIKDSPQIRVTEAAWPHPVYTQEQMDAVVVAHREAKTFSDKFALTMVRILRWGLDLATGYKHDKAVAMNKKDPAAANSRYGMTARKYMVSYRYSSHTKDATTSYEVGLRYTWTIR